MGFFFEPPLVFLKNMRDTSLAIHYIIISIHWEMSRGKMEDN